MAFSIEYSSENKDIVAYLSPIDLKPNSTQYVAKIDSPSKKVFQINSGAYKKGHYFLALSTNSLQATGNITLEVKGECKYFYTLLSLRRGALFYYNIAEINTLRT